MLLKWWRSSLNRCCHHTLWYETSTSTSTSTSKNTFLIKANQQHWTDIDTNCRQFWWVYRVSILLLTWSHDVVYSSDWVCFDLIDFVSIRSQSNWTTSDFFYLIACWLIEFVSIWSTLFRFDHNRIKQHLTFSRLWINLLSFLTSDCLIFELNSNHTFFRIFDCQLTFFPYFLSFSLPYFLLFSLLFLSLLRII